MRRRRGRVGFGACCLVAACGLFGWIDAAAAGRYYDLVPEQVAADTYVFFGARESLRFANHGAIANTAFIVTEDGVVVIDTGASRLYGEAMRAAIRKITDKPVVQVYNTHAHPDHFLGNNAFADAPIAALPGTIEAIRSNGAEMAKNLYNLVGPAMRGTSAVAPTQAVQDGDTAVFGRHKLRLIGASGHTAADLMVLDTTTGVLFTGGIAFYQRAPTTPNADLDAWQAAIAAVGKLDFKVLVPAHGPAANDAAPRRQTAAYLHWLRTRFEHAAQRGDSEAEVMFEPLPPRWAALAVEPGEYRRSVSHLYPAIECAAFANEGCAATE